MDDEVGSGGPTCENPGAESQAALRRRASSLETLNAVADAVHRSLDVGTVARDAIDALRRYKPFGAASILALSEDGENLLAVADEGFNPDMVRERIPVEGSLVGLAVRRATVVTTDDLSRETRGIREMREALVRDGFRGVTIVPLIHSGRPLGVMALVLPGEDRLTAEERETLLAVGKTVALAMDNARQAQELREKELRYTLATEAAKVGVWDWNIETGDFYLDPNLKALLGYSDDEIPNDLEAWSTHIHPDDRSRVESMIAAHIEGRAPQFVCDHRMLHKDGSERWILARGNGMRNSDGKIVRVVGTDFDITVNKRLDKERRELEQQMLHAEKLKSLGVLSGGIAHEFNNLLTAILGNAGLAHRSAEPGSTIRRRIEQIEAATQRATGLTRQLLAYSGRGTFVLKPIDVSSMIREMSDLLRVSVSKKAELIFECAPGQPLLQGDPGQIRQLVLNLVTNASEALGEENGSIVVRTSAAEGSGTAGGGLSIEVSDTGCGIPEQDRERIYEPFFTTKFTGRGLGLAAVHGIVRGHQGSIEVRSAVGSGTTFRVVFPAYVESLPAADDERPDEVANLATRTVLVVDDEDSVLSLAQAVLDEAGCEVLTAANGHEAISVYGERSEEIDVVVLDLSMPSLNGLETFRAMRTIRPDARVILSSGHGPVDLLENLAGRPLAGYLEKPYAPDRLVDEVRRALRR